MGGFGLGLSRARSNDRYNPLDESVNESFSNARSAGTSTVNPNNVAATANAEGDANSSEAPKSSIDLRPVRTQEESVDMNNSASSSSSSSGDDSGEGQEVSLYTDGGVVGKRTIPQRRKVALVVGVITAVTLAITLIVILAIIGRSFRESASTKLQDALGATASNSPTGAPSPVPSDGPSAVPSTAPTFAPSDAPSASPSSTPSGTPSVSPTSSPSSTPSTAPSQSPSSQPSTKPSGAPTSGPTKQPTKLPTTNAPTAVPSSQPTRYPTAAPTVTTYAPIGQLPTTPGTTPLDPSNNTLTQFCVIADVPYFRDEEADLIMQIENQMAGCEFLVHLGDIMSAASFCSGDRYTQMRTMLDLSPIPVFIVPGDNEWNDCGNQARIDQSWNRWTEHFLELENNWQHSYGVVRQYEHPENFAFVHKKTLFIGLNIVGGAVHNSLEWGRRHAAELHWVTELIRQNVPSVAMGVIIMAHARPVMNKHGDFFNPFKTFMRDELQNEYPILYLHGDGHEWNYAPNFQNQNNMLRVQHEGGTRDPMLKVSADPFFRGLDVRTAFQFDRQLELETRN